MVGIAEQFDRFRLELVAEFEHDRHRHGAEPLGARIGLKLFAQQRHRLWVNSFHELAGGTPSRLVQNVERSQVAFEPILGEIRPRSLAHDVGSERIHCGVEVTAVRPGGVQHTGGTTTAQRVIVATDGTTAARLVPGVPAPTWNALTTWYFSAPLGSMPADPKLLMVDGRSLGVLVNVAAVSAVAPRYARPGELLVAATAVGAHDGDAGARRHLAILIPGADQWELVGRYEIPQALPALDPPADLRAPQDFDGILVAGDHRDTPSIQGALVSGRRAARTAWDELVVVPPRRP